MLWQFNPYIIPLLLGALPFGYATVIAWRQRDRLPERIFFWLSVAILWSITVYSLELAVTNPGLMLFLRRVQYMGGLGIPTLLLLFILAQTGRERFITRRNVILLLVEPVLYHLVVWTNEWHGLHWQKIEAVEVGGLVLLAQTYSSNLIFWLGVVYLYSVVLICFYLIVSKVLTAATPFRNQYILLLAALVIPWATNFLDVTGRNPIKYLEITLYGLVLACLPLAWGLFRFRLLDLMPAAQDMVMRSIGDPVFVLDRADRVVDANPAGARLLSVELRQLIGQPAQKVFANRLSQVERFAQIADAQEQVTWETEAGERFYDVRISPLYNHWGQINGRVIAMHDLTHQKQAERQAVALALEQEKVRLLQQFIDASSHDLSTPITTLLMSITLLKRNTTQLPDHLHKLGGIPTNGDTADPSALTHLDKLIQSIVVNSDRIDVSIQRLQKLVAGMLELARLDKEFKLNIVSSDLNHLVGEVLREAESLLQIRAITLQFMAAPNLGQVKLDPLEFRRVIRHLLENALNFTQPAGVICLKTYQYDQQAVLEISDTGIGIAPEELPLIFDRFYRADKARSAQTGGMGVGLAVVKKIVTAHKGAVEVVSTPGNGAIFRVRLPVELPAQPISVP